MSKINIDNLLNNSSNKIPALAAKEWQLERYDETPKGISCELCGTQIKNYFLINNNKTGATLTIGCVCYDHLLSFFEDNRINSNLITRKLFLKKTKAAFCEEINSRYQEYRGILDAGSWLTWLLDQIDNAPSHLRSIIQSLRKMSFLTSEGHKQKLIEYHDSTRKFPREVLLPKWIEYNPVPPVYITIQDATKFAGRKMDKSLTEVSESGETRRELPDTKSEVHGEYKQHSYLLSTFQKLLSDRVRNGKFTFRNYQLSFQEARLLIDNQQINREYDSIINVIRGKAKEMPVNTLREEASGNGVLLREVEKKLKKLFTENLDTLFTRKYFNKLPFARIIKYKIK